MKRLIVSSLLIAFGIVGSLTVNAQQLDQLFKREDSQNRKPVSLPAVREADMIWSKTVWRIIDLREKMNQPLYYPETEVDGRINLINLLMKGIKDGTLTAYDASGDEEFKTQITYDQVKKIFGAKKVTKKVRNFDTGEMEDRVVESEMRSDEVKQFWLKEIWYFDKQLSSLQVRILGICPIREYTKDTNEQTTEADAQQEVLRTPVCWISYPAARQLLVNNEVFNPRNDAQRLSYDDLFIQRNFQSYIVKESNTYNNRPITAYLSSEEAMYESKRIEDEIFNFEQDLWEY
ncbi:MAG: gliding motility protein GldN [Bacteroidota bacterium]|nr:gliding motility protein GldN [Bacteroidota bacterium]MDP4206386.1 gliding motility protein GldN [Bacteroidota bacterium]